MKENFVIGFNSDERSELLEIFKNNPKWAERIKYSGQFSVCPQCRDRAVIQSAPEKLNPMYELLNRNYG